MRASQTPYPLLVLLSALPLAACDGTMEGYEEVSQPILESTPTTDNMPGAVASDGTSRLLYVWPLRGSDGKLDLWGRIISSASAAQSTPARLLVDGSNNLSQPEIVFANGKFWVFHVREFQSFDLDIWYAAVDPVSGQVVSTGAVDLDPANHSEPRAAFDPVRNEILVAYNDGTALKAAYLTPVTTGSVNRRFTMVPSARGIIQPAGHDIAFSNNRYGVVWNRMDSGEKIIYGSIASGAQTTIAAASETQIALGDHPTITAAGGKFAMALSDEISGTSKLRVALVADTCAAGNCSVVTQTSPLLTLGNSANQVRIRYLSIAAVGNRFFVPFVKHPGSFQDPPTALGFLLADAQGACVAPCERSIITTGPGTTFNDVFITSSSVATHTVAGRPQAYVISRSNRVLWNGLTRLAAQHRSFDESGTVLTQGDLQSL